MRGCTINNDDNTKRYLKADDWNKWEDGVTIIYELPTIRRTYYVNI